MGSSRGLEFQAVLISFLALCTITIIARCYTRIILVKRFAVEDWLAVIAYVLHVAYTTCALVSIHYGLCSHVVDIPLEDRSKAIMWRWIAITIYILISGLTKLVVALFLTRVCTKQRWQNITLWVIMGIIAVYSIFYAVLNINTCHPIEHEWLRYGVDPPDTTKCNSPLLGKIPTYIAGFLNVVVDWILAIVPATVLWNLQMDRRLKISTYIVLAIGSIASVASIVRLPYAQDFLLSPDYLYTFTDLGIWSTVEIGAGLSASSLATLKPLFRKAKILTTPNYYAKGTRRSGAVGQFPKGKQDVAEVYQGYTSAEYPLVSVSSTGRFAKLPAVDGIVMKKEIFATDLV